MAWGSGPAAQDGTSSRVLGTPAASDADSTALGAGVGSSCLRPCDFQGLPASKVPTAPPFPLPRPLSCSPGSRDASLGPSHVALPAAAGLDPRRPPWQRAPCDAHLWSRDHPGAQASPRHCPEAQERRARSAGEPCLPACLLEETEALKYNPPQTQFQARQEGAGTGKRGRGRAGMRLWEGMPCLEPPPHTPQPH